MRKQGFTLLEILLAVSILALVGTMIYGGFSQTALNKARVEEDVDHSRIIHMALERMARELTMAFVSTHVNPSLDLRVVNTAFIGKDNGKDDRIDFTSFSHRRLYRNARESDQNEISYFVTEHPDDPEKLVLARREQNRIDEDPRRGGKSQILVENVEEFNVEYFDPLLSEWVQTWNTDDILAQPNRLPTQVRIRLSVEDPRHPGRTQSFGTRVTIPITYALNHANYNP
ncbi:MAG: type II secretion system protein GspJ [Polyangiales bacterium]|jgi:general secretion pathway protein J